MWITWYPLLQNIGNLPLPFFVVITLLFSWIISINDFISIFNGSTGFFVFVYIILENLGNNNYPILSMYRKITITMVKTGQLPIIPINATPQVLHGYCLRFSLYFYLIYNSVSTHLSETKVCTYSSIILVLLYNTIIEPSYPHCIYFIHFYQIMM